MHADPHTVAVWSDVAPAYAGYWSERFRPFTLAALATLRPGPGPLWVVGAGPGDEALELARLHPDHAVVASDPSPAMCDLARARLPDSIRVLPNDACQLPAPLGAVVSCFVLQLLPDRLAALRAWRASLHPDGEALALFWPKQPDDSPWGRLGQLASAHGKPRPDWEPDLRARLPDLGLHLAASHDLRFEIAHRDPAEAWTQLRDSCSYRGFVRRVGHDRAEAIGAAWQRDSGLERRGDRWVHRPVARLWRLRIGEA